MISCPSPAGHQWCLSSEPTARTDSHSAQLPAAAPAVPASLYPFTQPRGRALSTPRLPTGLHVPTTPSPAAPDRALPRVSPPSLGPALGSSGLNPDQRAAGSPQSAPLLKALRAAAHEVQPPVNKTARGSVCKALFNLRRKIHYNNEGDISPRSFLNVLVLRETTGETFLREQVSCPGLHSTEQGAVLSHVRLASRGLSLLPFVCPVLSVGLLLMAFIDVSARDFRVAFLFCFNRAAARELGAQEA